MPIYRQVLRAKQLLQVGINSNFNLHPHRRSKTKTIHGDFRLLTSDADSTAPDTPEAAMDTANTFPAHTRLVLHETVGAGEAIAVDAGHAANRQGKG